MRGADSLTPTVLPPQALHVAVAEVLLALYKLGYRDLAAALAAQQRALADAYAIHRLLGGEVFDFGFLFLKDVIHDFPLIGADTLDIRI